MSFQSWPSPPWMFGDDAPNLRQTAMAQALTPIYGNSFTTDHLEAIDQILRFENLCVRSKDINYNNDGGEASFLQVAFSIQWISRTLAVTLGKQLITAENEATPRQRELQFRALFNSLIILYSQNVRSVGHEFHSEFLGLLRARFRDVHSLPEFQEPKASSGLSLGRFYKYECFFLLAASTEYFTHFTSQRPKAIRAIEKFVNWVSFALLATGPALGGGFDLAKALNQLNESIRLISRSFEARFTLHFTLYELTQICLGLYEYAKAAKDVLPFREISKDAFTSSFDIAAEIIKKVTSLVGAPDISGVSPPSGLRSGWNASINYGAPRFDEYYYFYGVIDCAVQIARKLNTPQMTSNLMNNLEALEQRMMQIVIQHETTSIRWKALEYLICLERDPARLVEKLTNMSRSDNHHRIREETLTLFSILPPCGAGYHHNVNGSTTDQWIEGHCNISYELPTAWDIVPRKCHLNFRRIKPIIATGISPDCRVTFFMGKEGVNLYRMSTVKEGAGEPIMEIRRLQDRLLCSAISNKCVAVISRSELQICTFAATRTSHGPVPSFYLTLKIPHTLIPHCMAICDVGDDATFIAIAGREMSEKGILIYKVSWDMSPPTVAPVPMNHLDMSKLANRSVEFVEFSQGFEWLCCSYNYASGSSSAGYSRVLVWSLTANNNGPLAPYEMKCEFGTVAGAKGVTSAFPFKTPSNNPWMFCTTWPSYERAMHNGEWSFLSPLFHEPTEVPRRLLRELTVLDESDPLIAGTVSPDGHILAARAKRGRISLVRLLPDPAGGVSGTEKILLDCSKEFSHQEKMHNACMRFVQTPDGLDFYAVDINGKVLVSQVLHVAV